MKISHTARDILKSVRRGSMPHHNAVYRGVRNIANDGTDHFLLPLENILREHAVRAHHTHFFLLVGEACRMR